MKYGYGRTGKDRESGHDPEGNRWEYFRLTIIVARICGNPHESVAKKMNWVFFSLFVVLCLSVPLSGNAAQVMNGGVTIDVPGYDAGVGWQPGVIYDATVTAGFGDATSASKTITITLPEGMRFTAYPVKGTPVSGSPGYTMDNNSSLGQFVSSVSVPAKQPYYPSYNGALSYSVLSSCETVEVPLKVTVDENVYYGPKAITAGIRAVGQKSSGSIGDISLNVNAVGSASFYLSLSGLNPTSVLSGSLDIYNLPSISVGRTGVLYPKPFFAKKTLLYYYYPKEVSAVSYSNASVVVATDPANGYFLSEWNNVYLGGVGQQRVNVSATGTPVGLHVASQPTIFQITMYDGTVVPVPVGTFQVNAVATANNKLDITHATNVGYYELSDDYYVSGPRFRIYSNTLNIKDRQFVEFDVDPNYEVIQMVFPKDPTLGTVGAVKYKTNLNPVIQTANPSQIVSGSNKFSISKSSLGLSENEYITYGQASIGSVSRGFETIGLGSVYALDVAVRLVGRLKSGVNTANVTLKTYALMADETVELNSESTVTRAVNRVAGPTVSEYATSSAVTMTAGETKNVSFQLGGSTYYYTDTLAMLNPIAYIRVPKNTSVDLSSIRAVSNVDGVLPRTVTGPYTSALSGETFVKVAITGKVGSLFTLSTRAVTLSFNLVSSLSSGGDYNWKDYIFWKDDISIGYTALNGYVAIVSDTLDVDNDGNVTEKLIPANNTTLSIIPKREIIIDTYIVPEGGIRRPPYDGTSAAAIRFTPGTVARYTVEILNNRTESADEVTVYIPVPKEGKDYGDQIQSAPFSWNMRLGAIPNVLVYDADNVDVTSSEASKYSIVYSETASNESDYQTASYSSTLGANATMIRISNISGIPSGQRAVLSFDYIVDETSETLALNPAKLGSTNDFRPYYYFQAGSAGWLQGTRVGALLEIGKISGRVFLDDDKNGLYALSTDSAISGKKVYLHKRNPDGSYALSASSDTDVDGSFVFDGLANGVYRVDFNSVKTGAQKFTGKDRGNDDAVDSDVDYVGATEGWVADIDPTGNPSKYVSAGVIDYDPSVDFSVSLDKSSAVLHATNTQTIFTEQLTATVVPDFFDQIKSSSQSIAWASDNSSLASVSNGLIQGSASGTAVITVTANDMYGNSRKADCAVTILGNSIPTLQAVDRTIEAGSTFDPMAGVTALDAEDGDITGNVTITENDVSSSVVGTYHVTYAVVDSQGNRTTARIEARVVDTTPPGIPAVISVGGDATDPYRTLDSTPEIVFSASTGDIVAIPGFSCSPRPATGTNVACVSNTAYTVPSEHVVSVSVTDSWGNGSVTSDITFFVDVVPTVLVISIGGDETSPYETDQTSPKAVVGSELGSRVSIDGFSCSEHDIAENRTTCDSNAPLSYGWHDMLIRYRDSKGWEKESLIPFHIAETFEKKEDDCDGSIGDRVWFDANGDGAYQKESEKGIEHIRIKLVSAGNDDHFEANDKTVGKEETDQKGRYAFEDLDKGLYKVVINEDDIEQFVQTYDPVGDGMNGKATVDLGCDEEVERIDFGFTSKKIPFTENTTNQAADVDKRNETVSQEPARTHAEDSVGNHPEQNMGDDSGRGVLPPRESVEKPVLEIDETEKATCGSSYHWAYWVAGASILVLIGFWGNAFVSVAVLIFGLTLWVLFACFSYWPIPVLFSISSFLSIFFKLRGVRTNESGNRTAKGW